jgi:hypothetical protein
MPACPFTNAGVRVYEVLVEADVPACVFLTFAPIVKAPSKAFGVHAQVFVSP